MTDSATSPPSTVDTATQRIGMLMAQVLGLPVMGSDDDFFARGGTDHDAGSLAKRIRDEIGYSVTRGDVRKAPTPVLLAARIADGRTLARHIIPIQPDGDLPPLFGVHVLGANEEFFRPLGEELGPNQPVFGLTVGMLTKDTPVGVEDTAKAYFDDIMEHFPDGPVALAAVSLGAYFAYDLAQRLCAAGREVRMLAMFDAMGPDGRPRVGGAMWVLQHVRRAAVKGLPYFTEAIKGRLAERKEQKLRDEVAEITEQSEGADGLDVEQFVAANQVAVDSYQPQPIDVPLTIYRATEDNFDSAETIADGLGWRRVAAGGFVVIDIEGGHLTILAQPAVATMARHMRPLLQGGAPGA
ncbi:MAG: thioesterase domain-containing protein [Paracoccaceae bacterium]